MIVQALWLLAVVAWVTLAALFAAWLVDDLDDLLEHDDRWGARPWGDP